MIIMNTIPFFFHLIKDRFSITSPKKDTSQDLLQWTQKTKGLISVGKCGYAENLEKIFFISWRFKR